MIPREKNSAGLVLSPVSVRGVMLCTFMACLLMYDVSHATMIVVNPGMDAFALQNPSNTLTADDMLIQLDSPNLEIDAKRSTGGPPFQRTLSTSVNGVVVAINFVEDGGSGVAPQEVYTLGFPTWPAGTKFDVFFSYPNITMDPIILAQGNFATEGQVFPVPEPSTISLLGLSGVLFLGYRTWQQRWRTVRGKGV